MGRVSAVITRFFANVLGVGFVREGNSLPRAAAKRVNDQPASVYVHYPDVKTLCFATLGRNPVASR